MARASPLNGWRIDHGMASAVLSSSVSLSYEFPVVRRLNEPVLFMRFYCVHRKSLDSTRSIFSHSSFDTNVRTWWYLPMFSVVICQVRHPKTGLESDMIERFFLSSSSFRRMFSIFLLNVVSDMAYRFSNFFLLFDIFLCKHSSLRVVYVFVFFFVRDIFKCVGRACVTGIDGNKWKIRYKQDPNSFDSRIQSAWRRSSNECFIGYWTGNEV